jgi:alpha-tubulin suppressor-like RCC1 family protein
VIRTAAVCIVAWSTACAPTPSADPAPTPTPTPQPAPTPPSEPPKLALPKPARVTLAAGDEHTCALVRPPGGPDRIKCWGDNTDGALGLGDDAPRGRDRKQMGDALPFVDLAGPSPIVSLAAAGRRSCALRDDGRLFCWGDNGMAQLGLGDERPRGLQRGEMGAALPAVDLPGPVVAVALGTTHTCAALESGDVVCWGANHDGQLGLGDRQRRGDGPGEMGAGLPRVDLGAGLRVRALAAGAAHTCALFVGEPGRLKCWGDGSKGQLGLADTAGRGGAPGEMGDALPFVDLGRGRELAALTVGGLHACALATDGRVQCWGGNSVGQLGRGDLRSPGSKPGQDPAATGDAFPFVDLGEGVRATAVAAGSSHTCAIVRRGEDVPKVRCWGWGLLGTGSEGPRGGAPGEMGDALPFVELGRDLVPVALAAGGAHTCAVLVDRTDPGADLGRVKCWGRNASGALGLGDTDDRGLAPGEMGHALPFVDLGDRVRVVAPPGA